MINPTKLSELENDVGFVTKKEIAEDIENIIGDSIASQDFMEEILSNEIVTLEE